MGLRERKKLEVWRAIRAAALRLFDEHGYEAVTTDQIAAAANVSRTTFFNYFASKEAVVLDRDPEELDAWRALMAERPADEPLWDALTAIYVGFERRHGQSRPLRRGLKTEPRPDCGQQFHRELQDWALARTPADHHLMALLQLNLAEAAAATAHQHWGPGEPHSEFLRLLEQCLRLTGSGAVVS